ncbi:hypothetical protein [Mesoflavibacter sp. CH_XMU1404-2]|uniref:hypothetical protein n=1 Tax=Mesoflavibacter sp. CH_XMU1404-2 TaxID=3107766 RepID=UPI0030087918
MSKAQLDMFLKRLKTGKNDTQKLQIYNFIKRNPGCTIEDIHFQSVGMKMQTITGRVSELADLGVVKYVGTFTASNDSKLSTLCIITDPKKQLQQQSRRKLRKKKKAIKTLLTSFENQLNANTIQSLQLELS